MRVFVLALAILLLPLRGWIGDAMALGVGQQQLHRQHAQLALEADVHATHGGSSAVADHAARHDAAHDHMSQDHAAHEAAPQQAPNDCQSTCGNCQLCHTVAMTLPPELPMLTGAPRLAPACRPSAFASAELAPGVKPPIS